MDVKVNVNNASNVLLYYILATKIDGLPPLPAMPASVFATSPHVNVQFHSQENLPFAYDSLQNR